MKQLWKALAMVWRCDRWAMTRRVVYVLLQSVLPLLNLYVLKLIVDAVASGAAAQSIGPLVGLMAVVFLGNRVVGALAGVNSDVLSQRLADYTAALMQNHAAELDYGYYDTPAFHDTLHRAQQEASSRPLQIMNSFMALFGAAASIVGVAAMLGVWVPWVLPLMVVAVVPAFMVRLHKARSIYNYRRNSTQQYRQTAYYGSLLTTKPYAAEVRAFRLARHFRSLFTASRRQLVQRLLRISRRLGVLAVLCAVVEAAAMVAVVALLVGKATSAAITMGTFVMLFEAFRRGQGYLSALATAVAALYDNRLFAANLFEFLDMKPRVVAPKEPRPLPEVIESIELRDVTFRYPGAARNALEGFCLTCRRGELTRLEGQNGYGKTTVLRLILRLYDPDKGAVLLNGTDIRLFDPAELRARMAVLFQDFARYAATARENMGYGSTDSVAQNLPQQKWGWLTDFVERLPKGYDTPLTRLFDEGQDLSMGQWQRVALARALHAEAQVLLLDEPMAWLDVETRTRLMQSLDEVARERIVIMINHI